MVQYRESPKHAARRTAVRNIWKGVRGLETVQCEDQDLERIQVQVLPMTLDVDGMPCFEPCYFKPMKNNFPDPDPELLEMDFPPYDPQDDFTVETVYWAEGVANYVEEYIQSVIFTGLTEDSIFSESSNSSKLPSDPSDEELWDVVGADIRWLSTATSHSPKQPYFKCMMASNIDGNDRLTRWELECICKSMEKLLNLRIYAKHLVTPVMILSYMGPRQVRILLAHFDGTNMVIRKSQFYDMRTEDVEALRLLVRWWCSSESGDTING
ncbi:hypothetical protein BO94DRAFT_606270 [Aspergillus sclerotioniger CBS 115572]|uniref:Uncharacterized protein n=1 Tax=Aspergillus sclerotioniger CBS 115572 TaxID=1450535 RepID=A0A317XER5_9EURO|nr:hypothetical protein BO94DRAFT_606270 [Aspergillus sclerotioniger CBS 115572]PWY95110.1 hypothetical protein BO94DRAFT_606270 [Aspergillus sclerotioniger CBS 115572]